VSGMMLSRMILEIGRKRIKATFPCPWMLWTSIWKVEIFSFFKTSGVPTFKILKY
jgi:hypothetical protein